MVATRSVLKNRRGISELTSYVLLIVISLGLSVLVYTYLAAQAPKDKGECPADLKLVLEDWSCSISSQGTFIADATFYNKGLRNIKGVYVRVGIDDPKKPVKQTINTEKGKENVFFTTGEKNTATGKTVQGLFPGRTFHTRYTYADVSRTLSSSLRLIVELEPVLGDAKKPILCEAAITTQKIHCASCGNGILEAPAEKCDRNAFPSPIPDCQSLFNGEKTKFPTVCSSDCTFDQNSCSSGSSVSITPILTIRNSAGQPITDVTPGNSINLQSTTNDDSQVDSMVYYQRTASSTGTPLCSTNCPKNSLTQYPFSWTVPNPSETDYYLYALPVLKGGSTATATKSQEIHITTTGSSTSTITPEFISPGKDQRVTHNEEITLTVKLTTGDSSGVRYMKYYLNGKELCSGSSACPTGAPYTFTWTVPNDGKPEYELQATPEVTPGNSPSTVSTTVYVK